MGKKTSQTDSHENITKIAHNWDTGATNSLYSVTTYGANTPYSKVYYDKFARVVKSEKQDMDKNTISTTKTYNAKGELATQTDPNGNVTNFTYDNYGRQTSVQRPNPSGSGIVIDTIVYDDSNLKTTTTVDGMIKVVEKNPQGKVTKVTDATGTDDESTITYTYYADGNLKTTRDSGNNVITMTYDKFGNTKN